MKKSLIALAVAGAFAAPAFAASSNVDFYGQFRVTVDHLSNSIGWGVNDETSRIGFKGAEDLGGGLSAIFQWETGFNPGATGGAGGTTGSITGTAMAGNPAQVSPASGGLGSERDTFVGLSGGFGTAIIGRHDTPYKMAGSADLFADTLADAQNTKGNCIICEDLRVNNAIAYVSPDMSGLSLVGAIIPAGQGAAAPAANSLANAYSLAAMYNNGPLKLTAGYENLSKNALGGTANAQAAWKLNGSYVIGDLKLGATYENINHDYIAGPTGPVVNGTGKSQKSYLLSAAYGMGPITLAAQYGKRDPDGNANNLTDTTVGVVYGLSKRTSTYVGYAHYNADSGNASSVAVPAGGNLNVLTLGMNHSF